MLLSYPAKKIEIIGSLYRRRLPTCVGIREQWLLPPLARICFLN